jgi:chromosome segregation ATPase
MPHGSKLKYGGKGIMAEIYNSLENEDNYETQILQIIQNNFQNIGNNLQYIGHNLQNLENNLQTIENNFQTIGNNLQYIGHNLQNLENNLQTTENNFQTLGGEFPAAENEMGNYNTESLGNIFGNMVVIDPNGIDQESLNCILALLNDS